MSVFGGDVGSRHRARVWRFGAVLCAAGAVMLAALSGMSAAEAARTQKSGVGQGQSATIGRGVQIVRGFRVEASPGSGREFARGAAALALVRVRAQEVFPGWTIAFRPARTGLLGMTLVKQRRVEIYVRMDRPIDGIAHDIAHEFGHVADVMYNNDDQRQAFLDLRDRSASPWWTCDGCSDMQVGAGDFAEVFALWAAPPFRFYSEVAPKPSEAELAEFSALLPSAVLAAALVPAPLSEPDLVVG